MRNTLVVVHAVVGVRVAVVRRSGAPDEEGQLNEEEQCEEDAERDREVASDQGNGEGFVDLVLELGGKFCSDVRALELRQLLHSDEFNLCSMVHGALCSLLMVWALCSTL